MNIFIICQFFGYGQSIFNDILSKLHSEIKRNLKINMQIKYLSILSAFLFCFVLMNNLMAQEESKGGKFFGSLQTNGNFFMKDSAIGASNTPQYDNKKFGAESWLNLNYTAKDLDIGIRFDLFNNSNIVNPTGSYTDQGIGAWWIRKRINKLELSGGYLYDQIGSGIIYRAYEDRPLAIDNALYGVKLQYDITPDLRIKTFAGKVKTFFTSSGPLIKGASIDGFVAGKEGSGWSIAPGIGIVNQTFDDETIQKMVATVKNYKPEDGIKLYHNTYAGSVFNTLTYKNISLYTEAAYKLHDVYRDPDALVTLSNGTTTLGKFRDNPGSVLYGALTWSMDKFGVTVEYKRTENFRYRIDPFASGNFGAINFLPPMSRPSTYRLTAFYSAVTQELSEQAFQVEVNYKVNKKLNLIFNTSYIDDLSGKLLYRELYGEAQLKLHKKWIINAGIQRQIYNIATYLVKPGEENVKTITPFVDVLYKFTPKKTVRFECQYLNTEQDRGSWVQALIEVGIAPHWILTVSDMYNLSNDQKILDKHPELQSKTHYLTAGGVYTYKSSRFSLNYVKQVAGIVCSGGVCRYEPAFSGIRVNVLSHF